MKAGEMTLGFQRFAVMTHLGDRRKSRANAMNVQSAGIYMISVFSCDEYAAAPELSGLHARRRADYKKNRRIQK